MAMDAMFYNDNTHTYTSEICLTNLLRGSRRQARIDLISSKKRLTRGRGKCVYFKRYISPILQGVMLTSCDTSHTTAVPVKMPAYCGTTYQSDLQGIMHDTLMERALATYQPNAAK
jgi:hypothetical protein